MLLTIRAFVALSACSFRSRTCRASISDGPIQLARLRHTVGACDFRQSR
jgi:hypothetical protein